MAYTLGLDIGITSVGWAVLDWDRQCISDLGVRLFTGAEHPKDGSSLAAPRREARSARRRTRRKACRMLDIRKFIVRQGILTQEKMDDLFSQPFQATPWQLRAAGLDNKLSAEEFSRVLIHIAKHRGFKSNRTVAASGGASEKEQEEGKANASITANRKLMAEQGYRTVGEMICADEKFKDHKRNKAGDYTNTIARPELEKEIKILFEKQRELGNPLAKEDAEREYLEIFARQLPFASGEAIEKLTGFCTFEPACKRAPKACWTAERFVLLSRIANLSISSNGKKYELPPEDMKIIAQMAYKQSKVTYKQIRAAFDTEKIWVFAEVPSKRKDTDKDPEEKTFVELKAFHGFRKAITDKLGKAFWENLITTSPQTMDTLAMALTFRKTDDDIRAYLQERGIEEDLIEAVLPLNFSGVVNLSLEAMAKLIPHMELGLRYDEACAEAGYCHYNIKGNIEKSLFLACLDREEVRNPVVFRALTQTRKVVNAIIRKHGSPQSIHIELARELAKSKKDRNDIEKKQESNYNEKQRLANDFFQVYNRAPNGTELLKYRLWKEQGGNCPYSGCYIDPHQAFMGVDGTYAEIDHIIPYSKSFNDSYLNKVLVIGSENRNKQNRTPYEYLGTDEDQWHEFVTRVDVMFKSNKKKAELLKKRDFDDAAEKQMKDRSLYDTRYITTFAANWMESSLIFSDQEITRPVTRINGQATRVLRGRWGVNALKNREESDLHHALDACVVAAATQTMIKRISDASSRKELGVLKKEGAEDGKKERLPEPWKNFRKEVEARLSPNPAEKIREFGLTNYSEEELSQLKPIFISRKPERKSTGAAHQETIRSAKYLDEGMTAVKTPLTKLKIADLEMMVDKERNKDLYDDLKARLQSFDNKPEKAFKEPFRRRRKNGEPGPLVRSVKILSAGTTGVPVRGGIAANGGMVRVDVYSKDAKFYLIPYYVDDVAKKRIKNRAIIAAKDEPEWQLIDSSYEFRFSLFSNDLVRVVKGSGEELFAYYCQTHRGTGNINLRSHDGAKIDGVGVKTAKIFEKYQVDVLGNYYKVKKERAPHELA